MILSVQHPQLYEINTRVWLNSLSQRHGKRLTLGQVDQGIWERLRDLGMDLVWLMGVWLPSREGIRIARNHPGLQQAYRDVLPDLVPEDVIGSPYAVAGYRLNPALGNEQDLIRLRECLHRAGLGLILDFVPNHTARDHPWVCAHYQRYVYGVSSSVIGPEGTFGVHCADGETRWIAHGRDPYFPPWTDTAQLCSLSPETRHALSDELLRIAQFCDGLRCDMAMLAMNRIFKQTWGGWMEATGQIMPETEYWPDILGPLRARHPHFILIAEAYWGLERELLDQGFDFAYDKQGYDRLRSLDMISFKNGLMKEGSQGLRMVRFLENHDEERLAAVFPGLALRSAAVIHATMPGLRLFHHGQLEGRRIRLPVQLGREPVESVDPDLAAFYRKLLSLTREPLFKGGVGYVLSVRPAWEGDEGHRPLVGFAYSHGQQTGVVVVNHSDHEASGFLQFPEGFWKGWEQVHFQDRLSEREEIYERERGQLEHQGLYVRLGPHAYHFLTASL
ncbi:MAG: alpha-amylase family glycosyl hydrolase [Pseudomonadota bacterium]